MPRSDYPLPGSGDFPVGGPPLTGWIDEPKQVRMIFSPDGGMPVIEFVGHGKRLHIGLDSSLPGGSRALKLLRYAVDAAEHHERLREEIERAVAKEGE